MTTAAIRVEQKATFSIRDLGVTLLIPYSVGGDRLVEQDVREIVVAELASQLATDYNATMLCLWNNYMHRGQSAGGEVLSTNEFVQIVAGICSSVAKQLGGREQYVNPLSPMWA